MNRFVAGLAGVAGVIASALHLRRARATSILVAADPEAAMLASAAALRRLGARITRYDTEDGTIEAKVPPGADLVRLRASVHDGLTTEVRVEGTVPAIIRRFRAALAR